MNINLNSKWFLAATIVIFGLIASSSLAATIGTAAWAINNTTLNSGPGTTYPGTNHSVTEGQAVMVTRCSRRWCQIGDTNGWISIDQLSFGQATRGPFSGPKFDINRGGDGKVCFFDESNFSGASICLPSGAVARDLALWGWDNRISSVSVGAGVSVSLCRDKNFTSYCTLINKDTAHLERLLANAVSSYHVY